MASRFFRDLRARGRIHDSLTSRDPQTAVDPAGAVNTIERTVRDSVLLVGDAAGFVSGSSEEGIFPGMLAARAASRIIGEALRSPRVEPVLADYESAWRSELKDFLTGRKSVGGASFEEKFNQVLRHRPLAALAARLFLFGGTLSWGALLRACVEARSVRISNPAY